ncbi:MAG: hypothetical protein L0210_00635 [Rhodospirillales bacterium]|nr:hypothetical protein [Rhodospirillales bacterium]
MKSILIPTAVIASAKAVNVPGEIYTSTSRIKESNMRSRNIFPVLTITLLMTTSVFGQETPSGLKDLVGAKAAGGETELQNRGYKHVNTQTGTDRKWSNWWNQGRKKCVTVATVEGRYDSIVSTLPADCNKGTGSGGGAAAARETHPAAEKACLAAVAKKVGVKKGSLSVISAEGAEAGISVKVKVPDADAPWACMTDQKGHPWNVSYTGSEGKL